MRWNYLALVQIQRVAAALAVVFHDFGFVGPPAADFKVVGDNAGTFFQLLFEYRAEFVIGYRQEIDGDEIGGGVVLLQEVAVNDARFFRKAHAADLFRTLGE